MWHSPAGEAVRVLTRDEFWGTEVFEVLPSSSQRVIRVPASELAPLRTRNWTAEELTWRAAAAQAIALATAGEPLAVRGGRVVLLPHQFANLEKALASDPVRLAICDPVGLGKTISAGAIAAELKARGRARRILVVAPKGVQLQWVAEMADRFGEQFVRVGPEGVPVDAGINPWRMFDQVVCSPDAVKPLRARAGWDPTRVEEHNRLRFRAMVDAGWDLVIFDEAHHVAGSSEEVARHRLARELATATKHCLLLSGTPHSGKSDTFRRFVGLVDARFLHGLPLDRSTVGPIVVRTEQRDATDAAGRALFTTRTTSLEVVPYGERTVERALYEAVTDYVREGYGRARRERRPAVGFLVLLMQRLVSSSSAAIRRALERRAAVLDEGGPEQLRMSLDAGDWEELTGEEQFDALTRLRGIGWGSERAEVGVLLDLARRAQSEGPDAKALFVLDLLRRMAREESDPRVKLLIFTEFVPTQEMLLGLLADAHVPVVSINGTMGLAERALAQEAFRNDAQVLVSTDAGGEGINLQFAHIVANYDLPWSPSRVEQRIGRVARIGQTHAVRAFNLVMENSVDARVLEVLEAKLATILAEFGTDARDDVLETASRSVEDVYTGALVGAEALAEAADGLAERTREELTERGALADLFRSEALRPTSTGERIRTALERAAGGCEQHRGPLADTLGALVGLPTVAPGEPVPVVGGAETGWWSCFEVKPDQGDRRSAFAVFTSDTGGIRPHLAEEVWEALASGVKPVGTVVPDGELWAAIQAAGRSYAYRACTELTGGDPPLTPSVRPLLVVRVES